MRKKTVLVGSAAIGRYLRVVLERVDVMTLRRPLGDDSKTEYWVIVIDDMGVPWLSDVDYGPLVGKRGGRFRYRAEDFVIPKSSWSETPVSAARCAAYDRFLQIVSMLELAYA